MEEKAPEAPQPATQTPTTPSIKRGSFPIFGIIPLIIVVALLLGGAYYLGKSTNKNSAYVPPQSNTSPTQAAYTTPSVTQAASPSGTVTLRKITAGGVSGTVFGKYAVFVPSTWTDKHEVTSVTDKLTLSRGAYSLTINQGAFEGGGCIYPGDQASPMSQSFTDFVQIHGKLYDFRRSFNKTGNPAGTIASTICQKSTSENSYGTITTYGRIDAKTPDPSDSATLAELDELVASLEKE